MGARATRVERDWGVGARATRVERDRDPRVSPAAAGCPGNPGRAGPSARHPGSNGTVRGSPDRGTPALEGSPGRRAARSPAQGRMPRAGDRFGGGCPGTPGRAGLSASGRAGGDGGRGGQGGGGSRSSESPTAPTSSLSTTPARLTRYRTVRSARTRPIGRSHAPCAPAGPGHQPRARSSCRTRKVAVSAPSSQVEPLGHHRGLRLARLVPHHERLGQRGLQRRGGVLRGPLAEPREHRGEVHGHLGGPVQPRPPGQGGAGHEARVQAAVEGVPDQRVRRELPVRSGGGRPAGRAHPRARRPVHALPRERHGQVRAADGDVQHLVGARAVRSELVVHRRDEDPDGPRGRGRAARGGQVGAGGRRGMYAGSHEEQRHPHLAVIPPSRAGSPPAATAGPAAAGPRPRRPARP